MIIKRLEIHFVCIMEKKCAFNCLEDYLLFLLEQMEDMQRACFFLVRRSPKSILVYCVLEEEEEEEKPHSILLLTHLRSTS